MGMTPGTLRQRQEETDNVVVKIAIKIGGQIWGV